MEEIALTEEGKRGFQKAFSYARDWASQHRWQAGVAEMALGAGLIAAGVESGAIEMGTQLLASVFDRDTTEGVIGAAAGGGVGVIPGLVLKSIGVAALGTAVSVPALALMGGGALILGLAGYGTGRLIGDYLQPVPDIADLIGPGALLMVGVALLVDGARRVMPDGSLDNLAARFKDGVLTLRRVAADFVISTKEALVTYLEESIGSFVRGLATNPAALGATTAAVAGGIGVGSSVATASVTVLGSKTLGGAALALGLVSAPVWPAVAGGALALGAAYGIWRYTGRKRSSASASSTRLALPAMEALRSGHEPKSDS